MSSPFDIVKSLTQTKDNIYDIPEIFEKEYNPFMINRILSNSPKTCLFADMMNRASVLDKKMQYDFYRLGIPKTNGYTKYIKKEELDINKEHIEYVCSKFSVSLVRGLELYSIIGPDVIQAELDSRGGKSIK
jgi:hypothetical protein